MEKYLVVAEEISRQVFATPPGAEMFLAECSGGQLKGDGNGESQRTLASEGTAILSEEVPLDVS